MTIDALYPFAGNHAIQSVAFIVEWPTLKQLTNEELRAISSLSAALNSDFPIAQAQQQITVQVGAKRNKAKTPPPQMGGVQFLKPRGQAPGNFTRMLQVQRGNCSIVLNEYTRWADVWGNAKKWFDIVFPVVLSGRPLVSFTLQYHDVFSWRDNPQLLDFSEVFKADSPYLPPNCYSLRSAWHSHHGFISEIGDPYPGTEIDNINITINDIGAERQVSAMLVHKLTLATPVWSSDTATTVDSLAQILHERNKKLLREIFSESVQQKIGLTVKEDDAK